MTVPCSRRAGRTVEDAPRTTKDLAALFAEQWPGRDANTMSQSVRYRLPLVQVTPRGVWGMSHQPTWTTVEAWLGRSIDAEPDLDDTILRYLAAFGPATVADIQAWSRLQGLRPHVERLRPRLRAFRNERGQELLDVPEGLLPDPETPAPPRFLPVYDNALLSHADRTRIIAEARRKAIARPNGLFDATYLVDGVVAGTWKLDEDKSRATLHLQPFTEHARADVEALEREAEGLLRLLVPDVAERRIAHHPVPPT
jgi:hypothetical protein